MAVPRECKEDPPAMTAEVDSDLDQLGPLPVSMSAAEFDQGFGESLLQVLDLTSWAVGRDLGEIYRRIDEEVRMAVLQEASVQAGIREVIFPLLRSRPDAPKGAGVHQAHRHDLEKVHRGLLFNGGVEACDSTIQHHDTLPLTIFQIGVTLVSYLGNQGTWAQRLFRRDLRATGEDVTEELFRLLERREQRAALNRPSRDHLSSMASEGIMAYAERAILLRQSQATWRMGHGNPAPFALITGSGSRDLMIEATRVLRELIEDHQKFVFVASEPRDRVLLSIGQALAPRQYAIVRTLRDQIHTIVEHGNYSGRATVDTHWDGEPLTPEQWIRRFRDRVAPQVVVGVFRATRMAPPQMFYAHVDHADLAAHIAIADSLFQEHRGFPLLIDLADSVCRTVFGRETLQAPVTAAYAESGAPWRYISERAGRSQ